MNAVAAVNSDWGIGYNNTQSIVIPEDRRHFSELTKGGVVIAGRKTFEDIGRPLPNRKNIIMTRDKRFMADGIFVARSLDEVLSMISGEDTNSVYVIGGGIVYRLFLPMCAFAHITKIEAAPASDTFFHNLDESPDWSVVNQGDLCESNGMHYSFAIYENEVWRQKDKAKWQDII